MSFQFLLELVSYLFDLFTGREPSTREEPANRGPYYDECEDPAAREERDRTTATLNPRVREPDTSDLTPVELVALLHVKTAQEWEVLVNAIETSRGIEPWSGWFNPPPDVVREVYTKPAFMASMGLRAA